MGKEGLPYRTEVTLNLFPNALQPVVHYASHCSPEMTRSIQGQLKDAGCGVKGHSTKLGKSFKVLGQVGPYWEQIPATGSLKNNCQVLLGQLVVLGWDRSRWYKVGKDRALLEAEDGQDTSSHNGDI